MPMAATQEATSVRIGTGSLKNIFENKAVRSGLRLMTTSALAVVVSERAKRKAVNMIAHISPETRPGAPAARIDVHGWVFLQTRKQKTKANANRLRQNTCSKGSARWMWLVTTPALDQSSGAAIIRATAVERE